MKIIQAKSIFVETVVDAPALGAAVGVDAGMSYTDVLAKYHPDYDGITELTNLTTAKKLSAIIRNIAPGTGMDSYYFVKDAYYNEVKLLLQSLADNLTLPGSLGFEINDLNLTNEEIKNLFNTTNYIVLVYDYDDVIDYID